MQFDLGNTTLRQNFQHSGIMPLSVQRQIVTMLSNIKGRDGVRVVTTDRGIEIHGALLAHTLRCFDCTVTGATALTVAGGPTLRIAADGDLFFLGLTTDSGTSATADGDYKTLTGITATGYVILTLDDPDTPTAVAASFTTDPPATFLEEDGSVLPICYVVCASSKIVSLHQMHSELWLSNGAVALVDDLSINLTGGLIQDYAWADPSGDLTTTIALADHLMLRISGTAAKKYITWDAFMDELAADIVGTGGPWATHPWPNNHDDLLDIAGDTAGDDHNGSLAAGNFPYLSGRRDYDDDGQAFKAGGGLADSSGALSVDPDDRLLSSDWECAGKFNQTTDVTDATGAAGGAVTSAGGIDVAKKVWAIGGFKVSASNFWDLDDCYVDCNDTISLGAAHIVMTPGSGTKELAWKRVGDLVPDDYVLVGTAI